MHSLARFEVAQYQTFSKTGLSNRSQSSEPSGIQDIEKTAISKLALRAWIRGTS